MAGVGSLLDFKWSEIAVVFIFARNLKFSFFFLQVSIY